MVLQEFPDHPSIYDLDHPPTFSEVSWEVRTLKKNKTLGPDRIPAEIFKHGCYMCL